MKQRILILGLIALIGSSACIKRSFLPAGPVVTEDRDPGEFDKVRVEGSMDVHLLQDTTFRVRVKARQQMLGYIETYVASGRLFISERSHRFGNRGPMDIYVSIDTMQAIDLFGSGDVFGGVASGNSGHIGLNGSGNVDLYYEVPKRMDVDIVGSGNVQLKGSAHALDLNIDGSGNFNGKAYPVALCDVRIEGSGNADVFVTDTLNAYISGSGNINYWGNPKQVNRSIDGSGNVTGK